MGRDLYPTVAPVKSYQPEKWTGSHRRVVALEQAGYKPREIAEVTGYDPNVVSIILNDPRADLERRRFAEKVVDHVSDVQLKIALHADEALQEIVDEMRTCEKPEIRQRAAFGILDRAGHGPTSTIHTGKGASVPAQVLGRMEEVMKEISGARDVNYKILEPDYGDAEEDD